MKEIPLTKGYVALVDDDDYPALSAVKWRVLRTKGGRFYAIRNGTRLPGKRPRKRPVIAMHQVVAGYKYPDHIDGNGLNNQRRNLRPANCSQNAANTRHRGGVSLFKGVALSRSGRWRAYIRVNYKQIHLGSFDDEKAAATAYNQAAKSHFGEYALLNNV